MQYYFDRNAPMFIVTEPGFDATPISVDPDFAQFILELEAAIEQTRDNFDQYGAPEDSAQELADLFKGYVDDSYLIRSLLDQISSLELALQEVEDEEE